MSEIAHHLAPTAQATPAAAPTTVTSRDGTRIAYTQTGTGAAVVLVDGPFGTRSRGPNAALAPLLAARFSVYHYDRRGSGDSTATRPYAVEREIEDLAAVIDAAGGSARVYGISAGAILALETAVRLPHKIAKLAIYEPPCVTDDSRKPFPNDYREQITNLVASGRRSAAVKLFMRDAAAMPALLITLTRLMPPVWRRLTDGADSLVTNAHVMGDTGSGRPLPLSRFAVDAPTLVVSGAKSPAWLQHTADAIATQLSHAMRETLPGQRHDVNAAAIAPILTTFFAA
jgi:pimeloyl-ACP methyl ester carboxylesterase